MLDQTKVAKAGRVLFIDQGTYSDYHCIGVYIVKKDFIPYDILQNYLIDNPSNKKDNYFEHMSFLDILTTDGYIEEISCDNLYLGAYGNADEVDYR